VSSDDEDPSLPLTAADLPKVRAELTECMDPPEFRRRVDGFDKRSRPSSEHFGDPKRQFLHDAWVLAELSKYQPFVQIRLANVSEEPPDGSGTTGRVGAQMLNMSQLPRWKWKSEKPIATGTRRTRSGF
jgi:hypothetical protein